MLAWVRGFTRGLVSGDPLACVERSHGQPARLFWALDPVDGTKGFLRKDQYAVALALIEEGQAQLALLACPHLPERLDGGDRGQICWALKGGGAFASGLRGGTVRTLRAGASTPRLCESFEAAHADHALQARVAAAVGVAAAPVRMDSQAKYALVARGDASLYLRLPNPKTPDYREKIWDHAAGVLLVVESGGQATDALGRPLDFSTGKTLVNNRGVIASDGRAHQKVVEALAGG